MIDRRSAPHPSMLTLALLAAIACGDTGCTGGSRVGASPTPSAHTPDRALRLVARDLQSGQPFDVAQLRGKVVLVDFWASWCAPCRTAMPFYRELYARYRAAGLLIIGVSVDEDRSAALKFAAELPVDFPLLWDEGHRTVSQVDIQKMPTALLLDRAGAIRWEHRGFVDGSAAEIRQHVETLLGNADGANSADRTGSADSAEAAPTPR